MLPLSPTTHVGTPGGPVDKEAYTKKEVICRRQNIPNDKRREILLRGRRYYRGKRLKGKYNCMPPPKFTLHSYIRSGWPPSPDVKTSGADSWEPLAQLRLSLYSLARSLCTTCVRASTVQMPAATNSTCSFTTYEAVPVTDADQHKTLLIKAWRLFYQ